MKQKQEDQKKTDSSLTENQFIVKNARNEEQTCIKEQEVLLVKEQATRQKVNELRSLLEAEKSQGSVLRAILQARESGQIQGIYGRLGDLGAIDAKYDIAISTACGGLDYIVVETASAAQACVELLRTKGLGVATFLILDKQGGHMQNMKQKVYPPEGVPRLFDLVTVRDEKLHLAFYSTLGNTVVAKDLEQATRIAYGPHKEFRRVVTLDGAVFEKSGTMSGGGAKPQGGRMGTAIRDSTVSREALQDAEDKLSSQTQQLLVLKNRITAAIQQYQKAEKAISQLELDSAKNRMEKEGLQAQLIDITQQLETLKAGAIPAKQEVEKIQTLDVIIKEEQKELAKLQGDSKELREKANELQKKIENSGGDKLKRQKSMVEKLQAEIDSKSSEVNRRNVQITSGSKTLQKLHKAVQDASTEKIALIEDKEKKAKEFKEIEKNAFVVQEKYNNLQEVKEKQLKELESTKKDYNDLKNTIDKLRTGEVDAQYKLDDTKKLFKDWEAKSKMYQKKIQENSKELRLHIEQIQKEGLDPEKVKAVLDNEHICAGSSLQSALETLALLEAQLKECRPQLDSIAEYRRKAALYDDRVAELNDVTQGRDEIKRQYEDLRKKRLDEFMAGFNSISLKLKEMYQMITLGGDAELELVDSLDPFAEGVVFSVRPPKKSWKNIGNLSGGEKTLSSLALVFALHHYKPTPLYVMDEIDAALDFKNVSIVGHYIKDRTKDAQFIIISLRNNMFELADRLIGIYKTDNCTKSITINPKSFAVSSECINTDGIEVA
ncbi:hypothetical protein O6H91_13G085700 [Diphasiastrum complanatum]|nr:hypothetical protein O6H91_13G085700 [Diphasiastrum complanatum]